MSDANGLECFLVDAYPMHKAARLGRVDIMKELQKQGHVVNAVNFDQVTPLHEACFHGQFHSVQYLLENSALVNATNIDGSTPLCEASAMGYPACIQLLLRHGAQVNPPLSICTPLHEASIRRQAECTQLLVDAGAKLNASDCHFGTPLHAACYSNSVDCSQVLLRGGASVNATKTHTTPLHIASKHNYKELVYLLLDFGANVYSKDNMGRTAKDLAPADSNLVRFLSNYEKTPRKLQHECRVLIRNTLGASNLKYIRDMGLPSALTLYLEYK